MEAIVFDQPYVFVPPYAGRIWPAVLQQLVRWHLRRSYGITRIECRGLEHIRQAQAAGQGMLLTPNHCRPCDAFVVSELARQAGVLPYTLGSWHLFKQGRFQSWVLRRAGVFSIYREGMDRAALHAATDILAEARRPLVLFPEGVVSRSNDRLNPLMEGVALIARSAAKKRAAASSAGGVVVLPVALRYTLLADVASAVAPVLADIEQRLSWRPQREMPLDARIKKLGEALLALKETEYLGSPRPGALFDRLARLVDRLLAPIEAEYVSGHAEGSVVARVKKLRAAILPDMIHGSLDETERARRWRQLADLYLAQQLSFYPVDYVGNGSNPGRALETVERLEEDLTDHARIHRPMQVTATVGQPIPVGVSRERGAAEDPLVTAIESQLETLLGISS